MGGVTTAKKRFVVGNPVKAGISYKHTINGKSYIVQAKYDKTLSEFNAMWFNNLTPKEYFLSQLAFDASDLVLLPGDSVIVNSNRFVNDQPGAITKDELEVLFDTYKETTLVSGTIINGTEDHRIIKTNIWPYRNVHSEETKYFSIDNFSSTKYVNILNIEKEVNFLFEVMDTYVLVRAAGVNVHYIVVNFTGFTASYQGISPTSTTGTSATYTIPNALTTRRLSIIPNGTSLLLTYS